MPLWDGSRVENGSAFSVASIRFIFDSEIVRFAAEYAFSEKLETAFGYGTNPSQAPMKQSVGRYVPGGLKMKSFTGGAQQMRALIASHAADGKSYGTVWFPCGIQLIDANELPIDLYFENIKWEENGLTVPDSADPLKDELAFTFFKMSRNGLTLYDSSEEL